VTNIYIVSILAQANGDIDPSLLLTSVFRFQIRI